MKYDARNTMLFIAAFKFLKKRQDSFVWCMRVCVYVLGWALSPTLCNTGIQRSGSRRRVGGFLSICFDIEEDNVGQLQSTPFTWVRALGYSAAITWELGSIVSLNTNKSSPAPPAPPPLGGIHLGTRRHSLGYWYSAPCTLPFTLIDLSKKTLR